MIKVAQQQKLSSLINKLLKLISTVRPDLTPNSIVPKNGLIQLFENAYDTLLILSNIRREVNKKIIGRDLEVTMILSTLIAEDGVPVLLIGYPGTAKSEILNEIAKRLMLRVYYAQLSEYVMPSDVFGVIMPDKLLEGKLESDDENRVAGSNIVFFDEVLKANSAMQNYILSLFTERRYLTKSGKIADMSTSLLNIYGASNTREFDKLMNTDPFNPFLDRFPIRLYTSYLNEDAIPDLVDVASIKTLLKVKEKVDKNKFSTEFIPPVQLFNTLTKDGTNKAISGILSARYLVNMLSYALLYINSTNLLLSTIVYSLRSGQILQGKKYMISDRNVAKIMSIAVAYTLLKSPDVIEKHSLSELSADVNRAIPLVVSTMVSKNADEMAEVMEAITSLIS